MKNVISSVTTSVPVTFQSWLGQTLPTTVTAIAHKQLADNHYITLQAIVEPKHMATIFKEQWFHVNAHSLRNDVSFEADGDIEIELVLSPSITHNIIEQEADAEAILLSLLPDTTIARSIPSLTQAEHWYVTEAMQEMNLPAQLKQEGSVRHGFQTIWRQELLHVAAARHVDSSSIATDESLQTLAFAKQLEQCLLDQQLNYEFHNEQLVRLRLQTEQKKSWTELIRIEEDAKLIILYAIFPSLIAEQHREALALQYMNENYDLMNGAFEMDSADGELRFRSTLLCPQGIDSQSLAQLLHDHVQIMEHYITAIDAFE